MSKHMNKIFSSHTGTFEDSSADAVWDNLFGIFLPVESRFPNKIRVARLNKKCDSFFLDKEGFKHLFSCKNEENTADKPEKKILFHSDGEFGYSSDGDQTFFVRGSTVAQVTEDKDGSVVNLVSRDINEIKNLSKKLVDEYTREKPKIQMGILYNSGHGVQIRKMSIPEMDSPDIGLNYGELFLTKHDAIVSKMVENAKGIFLFHGPTGTGKTTYIKNLAKIISEKTDRGFIFIPTNQVDSLTNPEMISLLMDNANSVLVLEDAEKAVISRDSEVGNSSLVSTLLNLSDGILSSLLKLSIIITFNTEREKIDKALLRKGRLLAEHHFGDLSVEDAKRLAKVIGKNPDLITQASSLADIYNLGDTNFHSEPKTARIGFAQ